METKESQYIVFAVDHFNPLGLIRSLGEASIKPIVILVSQNGSILVKYCKYISVLHEVKTIEEGYKIITGNYKKSGDKKYLFATSDDIESYLDLHYDELINHFYFFNAGGKGKITSMMEKNIIVKLAKDVGLDVPPTEIVKNGEMPKKIKFPVLTKSTTSTIHNWKSNVFICYNEEDLRKAYLKINCETVILQEYIKKVDELNFEGFCVNNGHDYYMPLQNRYFRTTEKSYGNYAYIEIFSHPEILSKIKRLLELTHYNGIFEIEFIISEDKRLYFLEINFRNSAWLYAYTKCGLNFPLMYAKSIRAGKIISEDENIKKLPFTLMDELTDFKWSVLNKKVSIFTWIKELVETDCIFYYNKNDKRPFFMYLYHRLKRTFI